MLPRGKKEPDVAAHIRSYDVLRPWSMVGFDLESAHLLAAAERGIAEDRGKHVYFCVFGDDVEGRRCIGVDGKKGTGTGTTAGFESCLRWGAVHFVMQAYICRCAQSLLCEAIANDTDSRPFQPPLHRGGRPLVPLLMYIRLSCPLDHSRIKDSIQRLSLYITLSLSLSLSLKIAALLDPETYGGLICCIPLQSSHGHGAGGCLAQSS